MLEYKKFALRSWLYLSEEKIALFDFCGTMISFQSADAYVQYVKDHVPHNIRMNTLEGFRKMLVMSGGMRILQKFSREGYVNKRMLLRELKGISEEDMQSFAERFYRERIRPAYIPEVIGAVNKHKSEGFRLFIVSGGYDVYLKYVAEEFAFEDVISTCLEFSGGIFTGKYKGADCMNTNKVTLLKKYFGREYLRDCESIAYSDSSSDVPMMKFCRKGVAVIRNITPPPIRHFT